MIICSSSAQSSTSVNFISILLQCCIRWRMLCFHDSCNYSVSTKLLIFIFDAYVNAKNENVHFRYILSHASVKYFKFVFLWKLNLHNCIQNVARLQNLPLPISCVQTPSGVSTYLHIYLSTDWVMGCNESKYVAWASLDYAKPKNW